MLSGNFLLAGACRPAARFYWLVFWFWGRRFRLKKAEEELEIFLFVMGILAVSLTGGWSIPFKGSGFGTG